jgi:hypothetical protein
MTSRDELGRTAALFAGVALALAACSEDPGMRARTGGAPLPTTVAGLPQPAPSAPPARAPAAAAPTAGAPTAVRLDPAAVDRQSGHAFWVQLPIEWLGYASDHVDPQRSTLVVEEDGVALGPGNAALATVQEVGRGAYLHWGVWLYFSASDNSDPRTNGRAYRAVLGAQR